MRTSERITTLREKLGILPRAFAKQIADDGEVIRSGDPKEIVEDFTMLEFSTYRIKRTDLDHKRAPFQKSRRAQHMERGIDTLVNKPFPVSAIKAVIVRLLRHRENNWPGKEVDKWRILRNKALQWLWLNPDSVKAVEKEGATDAIDDTHAAARGVVGKKYKCAGHKDAFHQFDRDRAAAENESVIRPITGKDIVLVVDKNDELPVFFFAQAFQLLYGEEVLQTFTESIDKYFFYETIPEPDFTRHPLH